jgi:membrane-associated phospholipid phosphatase
MKVAHVISRLLHPFVMMGLTSVLMGLLTQRTLEQGTLYTAILALCLLPGILWYSAVRTNRLKPSHPYRVELLLLLVGFAATLLIYNLIGVPRIALLSLVVGIIAGAGATIINRVWDISFHAATSAGCAALFVVISWPATVGLAILSLVVGLARLPIKQHSLAQVVGGWIYGFGCTTILMLLLTR